MSTKKPMYQAVMSSCRGRRGIRRARGREWGAMPGTPAFLYLAVGVDDGAQQLPGAAATVHAHHAQDLQEAHAAQRRGGEDVALGAGGDDGHGGDEDDEI